MVSSFWGFSQKTGSDSSLLANKFLQKNGLDSSLLANKFSQKNGLDSSLLLNEHTAKKAIMYSALVPGMGQAYNKKYWKIPLIYAGLGYSWYMVYKNQLPFRDAKEKLFLKATLAQSPTLNTNGVIARATLYGSATSLRTQRETARDNRDNFILIAVAVYGLQLIDASVDAHLFDFDVNEDIGVQLTPNFNPQTQCFGLATVRWRF